MMANNDLLLSLLPPIPPMNRVYKYGQAIMVNVTTSLLLLPFSNGTAIMTANESILLPLYQNESAIMMVTCTNLCCFPSKTIQQLQWQLTQLTQFFCCFLFKMAQQLR